MAVGNLDPVSASNLGAAIGAASGSGGIGEKPLCVDNLRAALGAQSSATLYKGSPTATANLTQSCLGFDRLYCRAEGYGLNGSRVGMVQGVVDVSDVTEGRTVRLDVENAPGSYVSARIVPSDDGTTVTMVNADSAYRPHLLTLMIGIRL